MVGAGRERAEAPSSSARGARSSIPHAPLRRALLNSMATPLGPSSSKAVPSRGRGKGGKKRGFGPRGRGRGGRVTAREPSSPPPPAVSPEHVTARVDSSEEEATRTPVHEPSAHEPRVDGPSAHEPWVDAPSAHETPEEHTFDGVPGRMSLRGRVAMLMMAGSRLILMRRGAPSTSVVVHVSRLCRGPASRGG